MLSTFLHFFLTDAWNNWGFTIGVVIAVISVPALLPLRKPRRKKTISFAGSQGQVAIELDSVETTLNRVVGKMQEVKRIAVTVVPSDDSRRAQVLADVVINKGPEAVGARTIANRISDYLAETAVDILGVEDVTTVDLTVRGIVVQGARGKRPPEPELFSGPAAKTSEPLPRAVAFDDGSGDKETGRETQADEPSADEEAAEPPRKSRWSRAFGKKDEEEAEAPAEPVEVKETSFDALSGGDEKDEDSGAIG